MSGDSAAGFLPVSGGIFYRTKFLANLFQTSALLESGPGILERKLKSENGKDY